MYRKRYVKKRAYRKRPYRQSNTALTKQVNYIKTLVNSEIHNYEYSISGFAPSTGNLWSISAVPLGSINNERTGNFILPRYLNINLFLKGGDTDPHYTRVMLFKWKDDTAPTVAGILNTASVTSFLNEDVIGKSRDRKIDVLLDRKYIFEYSGSVQIKLLDKRMVFNGPKVKSKWHIKYINNDTTDEPIYNGLYLMAISDSGTGVTDVSVTGTSRLSFIDN